MSERHFYNPKQGKRPRTKSYVSIEDIRDRDNRISRLETLQQTLTATLQDIDENFAACSDMIVGRLIPGFQRLSDLCQEIDNGVKCWDGYFNLLNKLTPSSWDAELSWDQLDQELQALKVKDWRYEDTNLEFDYEPIDLTESLEHSPNQPSTKNQSIENGSFVDPNNIPNLADEIKIDKPIVIEAEDSGISINNFVLDNRTQSLPQSPILNPLVHLTTGGLQRNFVPSDASSISSDTNSQSTFSARSSINFPTNEENDNITPNQTAQTTNESDSLAYTINNNFSEEKDNQNVDNKHDASDSISGEIEAITNLDNINHNLLQSQEVQNNETTRASVVYKVNDKDSDVESIEIVEL